MTEHQHDNINNGLGSGALGIAVSFFLNQVMPWTIHTIGALLTAGIVAVSIFFLNRYLKNKFQ
jgi:uncharacterized membrane protein YecN with MAPEG domain